VRRLAAGGLALLTVGAASVSYGVFRTDLRAVVIGVVLAALGTCMIIIWVGTR
jgi:hypothetical protein